MTLRTKRYIFFLVWFLIIISGPVTILRNTSIALLTDPIVLANAFQRLTGLLAFTLIFIQIVLGSFMNGWTQLIGAKAYKLHITQGLMTYGFMFIHPLFENVVVYQVSKSITTALLVFVPSLETQRDIFLVFGRSAFVLATIAVIAAYFRTKPFFRRNWKAFHILNYLVFFLVWFHSKGLGTDVNTFPINFLYLAMPLVVITSLLYRAGAPYLQKLMANSKAREVEKNEIGK